MAKENDWNAALSEQEKERRSSDDAETQKYGEQVMSDFDNLVMQGNQRRAETRRMRDATLSAMILQARKGNGFVPPDVLDAASENMGFRVAGGNLDKNGNFILYGMQQGQDGSSKMVPVAVASPGMQLQTLSRAKMGLDYRRELYGNLSRRFTPAQLEKRGYFNPDAPQVVGSTTISSGTARRVFGFGGPERRGGGTFSADGKGGFTRTQTGPDGVTEREDFGTRDPNNKGRWKQISVGADPDDKKFDENGNEVYNPSPRQIRRYENDKTGEIVTVKDGETPPWERHAASEKERIAKMNNDSREAIQASRSQIAQMNNDSREAIQESKSQTAKEVAETSAKATVEKAAKSYDAAVARLDAAKAKKQALSASDLRVLSDIGKNYALPETARNAAVDKLVSLLSDGGGESAPASGDGEKKTGRQKPAGETSSGGGEKKKVSYNDLKPGQTFIAKGKDGQRHRYRKTENGYERIN